MARREEIYFRMMSFVHETLYGWFRDPYKALRAAGLRTGQRVLEVGCGPGFFTVPAGVVVGSEGSVLAIDVNPLAVEHVQAKIDAAGVDNVRVVQADASSTGLPDGSFDLAYVFGVAHPIGDMGGIWREVCRLLAPDGDLAVEGRLQPPASLFLQTHRQGQIVRYVSRPRPASPLPAEGASEA